MLKMLIMGQNVTGGSERAIGEVIDCFVGVVFYVMHDKLQVFVSMTVQDQIKKL
jgi:hypothetical protein